MSNALIDRLITEYNYPQITIDNHDEFVATPGLNVLFFPGNPDTVKDASDVAVILPELVNAFDQKLNPGVVTDTFGDGMKLKRQYGFTHYPALVFVRDGEYVDTLSRIQDWTHYLSKIETYFTAPVRRAPGFSIPVVAG